MYKSIILVPILILTTIQYEIEKSFKMNIEYRLEKEGNNKWEKRGTLYFNDKTKSSNYKPSIVLTNDPLTKETQKKIEKECENKGTYYLRFIGNEKSFFTSVDPVNKIIKNIVFFN